MTGFAPGSCLRAGYILKQGRLLCALLFGLLCCILLQAPQRAAAQVPQGVAPHELKGAFLLNFPNYFTWRNENELRELVIGVAGEAEQLLELLRTQSRGRQLRGKPLRILEVERPEQLREPQLLYVTPDYDMPLQDLSKLVENSNTLLVSDNSDDSIHTMINLVSRPNNTISFELNRANIIYEGLRMDNDILLLGGSEMDVATLFRSTETELVLARQQLEQMQDEYQSQQSELRQQRQMLSARQEEIDRLSDDIEQRELHLQRVERELLASEQALSRQLNELTEKNAQVAQLGRLIETNNTLLDQQESAISEQENQMVMQRDLLSEQMLLINNYRDWNQLIVAALTLFAVLSSLLFWVNRKRTTAHALLEKQNLELAHAQQELAHERDRADEANLAKSKFLTNLSHEIRSPMNAILGYSEMLELNPNADAAQKKNLDAIRRNGKHLLTLINDVLDMAKINSGKVELQQQGFDFHRLIDDIAIMFQGNAQAAGLGFEVDCGREVPAQLFGDAGKVRQVLVNLVSNALKYTRQGQVRVTIHSSPYLSPLGPQETEEQRIECRIVDTGIGIPEKEHEHIFGVFEQSSGNQYSIEGTGLGLAISRHYARMLGGDVTVHSKPGLGSTFIFSFVAAPAGAMPAAEPAAREIISLRGDPGGCRVLIVDDLAENQDLLTQMLSPLGFDLRIAENGAQAVELFSLWQPALVFMDLRMPVMDGITATAEIRKLEGGPTCTIIAVTANAFDEERSYILDSDMDGFIAKPFTKSQILACLASTFNLEPVYQRDQPVQQGSELTLDTETVNDELASLPGVRRAEMLEALEALDTERFCTLLEQSPRLSEALKQYLRELAEDFRFESLQELLHRDRDD